MRSKIDYGIYHIVLEDGENLSRAFKNIIERENNNIDNFYYNTLEEVAQKVLEKQSFSKEISTIVYERDRSLSPPRYRMLTRKEVGITPY